MPTYRFFVEDFVIINHEMIDNEIAEFREELSMIDTNGNGYFDSGLEKESDPNIYLDKRLIPLKKP